MSSIKRSTKLGLLGLFVPHFAFLFEISSFFGKANGVVFFSYLYSGGFIHSSGYFLLEPVSSKVMFKFIDLKWYFSPESILFSIGDLDLALNIFLRDFYGGFSGFIAKWYLVSFLILAISNSLSMYDEDLLAISGYGITSVILLGILLSHILTSSGHLIPIPLGILSVFAAVYFEWKERKKYLDHVRRWRSPYT